jgi:DNA polymerase-3 subunit alpha
LKITKEKQDETFLQEIHQLLKENQGTATVILHYEKSRKTIKLGPEDNVNPTLELLQLLRNILGPKNVVLKE